MVFGLFTELYHNSGTSTTYISVDLVSHVSQRFCSLFRILFPLCSSDCIISVDLYFKFLCYIFLFALKSLSIKSNIWASSEVLSEPACFPVYGSPFPVSFHVSEIFVETGYFG